MAYVKQTWSCGDEISAEKLNHMEDGIESANSGGGTEPLFVEQNDEEKEFDLNGDTVTFYGLTATYDEVKDALNSGRQVILRSIQDSFTYAFPIVVIKDTDNDPLVILDGGYFEAVNTRFDDGDLWILAG